jgi:capsular exopolysaccharide synthesis family protein
MSPTRSHPSDYLRVLYRRRWTAAVTFLLVFAYGAAGSLRSAPVYEAGTQLLIETDGQARALRSRTLAWRTLEGLGLGRPPSEAERLATADDGRDGGLVERLARWLGAPGPVDTSAGDETSWQSRQIDAFLDGVDVTPIPNSRIVHLVYRSADPVFAAKAANALSERYIEQGLTDRVLGSKSAIDFLSGRLQDQRRKVGDSELVLQRYTEQHGTPSVAARQGSAGARRLADASAELTRAKTNRLEQEAVLERWAELRRHPDDLDAFPLVRSDAVAQRLWTEIVELRAKDAHLAAAGYDQDREDRQRLRATLAARTSQLQHQIDRAMQAVRAAFQAARTREEALQKQLDAVTAEALAEDRGLIEYVALERDVISHRQVYEDLVQRAKEPGVPADPTRPSVQIIEAAEVPRRPVLPNRSRDLALALLTASLLAVGLAFGTEYLDSRIKNPDDIKAHLRLPFLGLVPAVSGKHSAGTSLLLSRGAPAPFGEAMRAVRTAVIFSSAAEGARSLMVTSTAPSEGKTVMSSNLAEALAHAELRTVVIDADMRRPRIHEVFGVSQEPGLSNVLVGTAPLAQALRPTDNPFLSVLPAGHVPPNPAELLGSPRYQRLLDELGAQFDWIVVDAPPVMAVTDAAVVAHAVSGVIFVIGAEMIPRRTAQNAIEQLVQARAKIVGAVLNRAEIARHAYYFAPYERKEYTSVDAPRL